MDIMWISKNGKLLKFYQDAMIIMEVKNLFSLSIY